MPDASYDVIVIGAGPGGYVTAIRAAQLGFKTAIIERSHLGGICLNWGCIPTKALLRTAEIYGYMQHPKEYGLSAENVSYDPKAVVKRSRDVAARMGNGVAFLMKKNKVDVIWGTAKITKPGEVQVTEPGGITRSTRRRRRARWVRERTRPSTSSFRPARGRACCPASSRTASRSGPITRR
jgi:dihydrolipoamide dehydrogenase